MVWGQWRCELVLVGLRKWMPLSCSPLHNNNLGIRSCSLKLARSFKSLRQHSVRKPISRSRCMASCCETPSPVPTLGKRFDARCHSSTRSSVLSNHCFVACGNFSKVALRQIC